MSSFRCGVLGILCVCIVLTGCQVNTAPRTVARYQPGDTPDVRKARYWGEYRLYALGKARHPAPDAEPLGTVRLAADEWVGFKRDASGYVVATAAEQVFPLERQQRYAWQVRPDPTQPDNSQIPTPVGVVAAIAVGVFLAAVIVAGATI